ISSGVTGSHGDIEGVCIEPVTAQVMMTFSDLRMFRRDERGRPHREIGARAALDSKGRDTCAKRRGMDRRATRWSASAERLRSTSTSRGNVMRRSFKSRLPSARALLAVALISLSARAQPELSAEAVRVDRLAQEVARAESVRRVKLLQRTYAQYAQFGLWDQMAALFAENGEPFSATSVYADERPSPSTSRGRAAAASKGCLRADCTRSYCQAADQRVGRRPDGQGTL